MTDFSGNEPLDFSTCQKCVQPLWACLEAVSVADRHREPAARGGGWFSVGLLGPGCFGVAIRLSSHLFAFEFLSQLTFEPFPFAWLQKEGVSFHILNDAFLLHLSLETAKGTLNGFPVEYPNFCQFTPP
jgi:hypothetical protein